MRYAQLRRNLQLQVYFDYQKDEGYKNKDRNSQKPTEKYIVTEMKQCKRIFLNSKELESIKEGNNSVNCRIKNKNFFKFHSELLVLL